jgi:tetratricopeptide (TPR) repeat protein
MSKKKSSKNRSQASIPVSPAVSVDTENAPSTGASSAVAWWEWAILAAIILVAIFLRAAYLVEILDAPDFDLPLADAAFKDYWARAMLSGDFTPLPGTPDPEIETTPYVRPPAYPFFLAFVYLLSGGSYLAVRVIQMAVGLGSIYLGFLLGRRLFAPAVGLLSAAFMAVYWVFIYFEGELNAPSLLVFLFLSLVLLLMKWQERLTVRLALLTGLVFGLLILDRSETILLMPFLLLWAWWASAAAQPRSQVIRGLAAFVAAVVLCIAPVTLRNYVKSGEFVVISTIGGLNLYAGNNPQADGSFPNISFEPLFGVNKTVDHVIFPQLVEALERKTGQENLQHSDLQRYFVKSALAYMAENPGRTLQLALRKALLFWGPKEVSSNKVIYFEKQHFTTLRYLPGFPLASGLFFAGVVMLLASFRSKWTRNRQWTPEMRAGILIGGLIFISFATYLIFFVVARFRVPLIPFFLIVGAYAVWRLWQYWQNQEYGALGRWSLVTVAIIAACHIDVVGYEYDLPRWHFQRAGAYGMKGEVDKAISELHAAVEAGGSEAWLYSELGFAYLVKGDYERSEKWLGKAIEIYPNLADAQNKYGLALLQLERFDEAEAAFQRALDADFTFIGAQVNLGSAYEKQGDYAQARAVFEEVLLKQPDNVDMDFRIGNLYALEGRHEEAAARLRKVVEAQPDHAQAWNYLGYELATLGQVDEAIVAYTTAVSVAPQFSLAHNNLGNALAHVGRYDEAKAHYGAALRADPEDPYADYGLGFAWSHLGNSEIAIICFRNALEKNPDNADAHNFLGYELTKVEQYNEAVRHLQRAIELQPNMILAHNNLGDVLMRLGRTAEAASQFARVLELDPGNAFALERKAQLETGEDPVIPALREGERALVF